MIGAEGWYVDPFGRHAQRWFSDGHPTGLVRDGGSEGQDDPPSATWDGPLEAVADDVGADELLRAGDECGRQDPDEAGHYG